MHITCPSACVGAYLAVPICLEHYSGIVTFIRRAKWWVLGTDYESMCALSSVDAVWGDRWYKLHAPHSISMSHKWHGISYNSTKVF